MQPTSRGAVRPPPLDHVLLDVHARLGAFERGEFFKTVVVPSGYPYFSWNDVVYQVSPDRTGCTETRFVIRRSPRARRVRIEPR